MSKEDLFKSDSSSKQVTDSCCDWEPTSETSEGVVSACCSQLSESAKLLDSEAVSAEDALLADGVDAISHAEACDTAPAVSGENDRGVVDAENESIDVGDASSTSESTFGSASESASEMVTEDVLAEDDLKFRGHDPFTEDSEAAGDAVADGVVDEAGANEGVKEDSEKDAFTRQTYTRSYDKRRDVHTPNRGYVWLFALLPALTFVIGMCVNHLFWLSPPAVVDEVVSTQPIIESSVGNDDRSDWNGFVLRPNDPSVAMPEPIIPPEFRHSTREVPGIDEDVKRTVSGQTLMFTVEDVRLFDDRLMAVARENHVEVRRRVGSYGSQTVIPYYGENYDKSQDADFFPQAEYVFEMDQARVDEFVNSVNVMAHNLGISGASWGSYDITVRPGDASRDVAYVTVLVNGEPGTKTIDNERVHGQIDPPHHPGFSGETPRGVEGVSGDTAQNEVEPPSFGNPFIARTGRRFVYPLERLFRGMTYGLPFGVGLVLFPIIGAFIAVAIVYFLALAFPKVRFLGTDTYEQWKHKQEIEKRGE